jgi:hypothetical protein
MRRVKEKERGRAGSRPEPKRTMLRMDDGEPRWPRLKARVDDLDLGELLKATSIPKCTNDTAIKKTSKCAMPKGENANAKCTTVRSGSNKPA